MNKKEYSRKYYQKNRDKLLKKAKEYSAKENLMKSNKILQKG